MNEYDILSHLIKYRSMNIPFSRNDFDILFEGEDYSEDLNFLIKNFYIISHVINDKEFFYVTDEGVSYFKNIKYL